MAPPSNYTEQTLGQYILDVLGAIAAFIGWTTPSHAGEAINDTMLELGVSDLADVTRAEAIRHLRAVARYYAWKAAAELTSGKYDFDTGDSGSFKRSQMHKMTLENAEKARSEANEAAVDAGADPYPGYAVGVSTLRYTQDPYAPLESKP